MRNAILAPVLLLFVAACAQGVVQEADTAGEVAASGAGPMSAAPVDKASCEAAGGFIDRRGRMNIEMCVHPYADAGTACTDNQQCDGKCVTSPDAGPDGEVVGQCQADDALFGCYAEVVDRKVVRAICID